MSAVPTAPCVSFQPLSLSLAYPGFPRVSLLLINMAAAFIISLKIWSPDSIIFYYAEVSQVSYILLAY